MGGGVIGGIGDVGRAVASAPKFLTDLVKGPQAPQAPNAPEPPPASDDPAVQAAQDAERRARGRSSTILTGGTGVGNGSGLLARRTLLGS